MELVIVGLGPGQPGQLTLEAREVLDSRAGQVILRTRRHPTVDALPLLRTAPSYDACYEQYEQFDQVYDAIVADVLSRARQPEGVVYAVPGHPLVAEETVTRLLSRARAEGIPHRIVAGLSFIEPALTALGIDGIHGLQLADALGLGRLHHPPLDPDRPALIGQLYSREVASDVKLTLMNQYPHTHPVSLVRAAGTPDEAVVGVPLYELDRVGAIDHLTALYIPPLPAVGGMESFQETIAHLRGPDGCPWDREQTHATLRTNLLEETYEALQAIDRDDMPDLSEELGDLLLQIVLHAQIATEAGQFQMADVVRQIDAKLKRRHPHVFAGVEVGGSADVLRQWEEIKRDERIEHNRPGSMLDSIPGALPALNQAQEYQRRAARVGFDWPDIDGVWAKVTEELGELRGARKPDEVEDELGDLLFAVVNLARWLKVDAESALRQSNARFARRFRYVEHAAASLGRSMGDMTLGELDELWEKAKAAEDAGNATGGGV